jgi:hypothetical protein
MQTQNPATAPRNAVVESTGRHAHDPFQLAWVRNGMGRVYCRGAAHEAAAGSVVVVAPGEMHHGHSVGPDGWSYLLLKSAPGALKEVAAGIPGRATPDVAWVASRDAALSVAFARWAHAAQRGEGGLEADSLAWEAMAALAGGVGAKAGRAPAAVRHAVDYLEAHYAEPVSLDRLAAVAGALTYNSQPYGGNVVWPNRVRCVSCRANDPGDIYGNGDGQLDVKDSTGAKF